MHNIFSIYELFADVYDCDSRRPGGGGLYKKYLICEDACFSVCISFGLVKIENTAVVILLELYWKMFSVKDKKR